MYVIDPTVTAHLNARVVFAGSATCSFDHTQCVILILVEQSGEINFQLQWVGDLTSSPTVINQILIAPEVPLTNVGSVDSHVLALGYVAPPVLPPNMSPEMAEHISSQPLPVVPQGRFLLTTGRLRELRDAIDEHLQKGMENGHLNN